MVCFNRCLYTAMFLLLSQALFYLLPAHGNKTLLRLKKGQMVDSELWVFYKCPSQCPACDWCKIQSEDSLSLYRFLPNGSRSLGRGFGFSNARFDEPEGTIPKTTTNLTIPWLPASCIAASRSASTAEAGPMRAWARRYSAFTSWSCSPKGP